jgi:DNA-directed RNA polymerase I, II, and III subunit RPABC1
MFDKTQKAYDICEEIFIQRGYRIDEKNEECILASKKNEQQICGFISKSSSKFNVERIQEIISMLNEMSVYHCIIVYKDSATPVAKKIVEESEKMKIEIFHEDELQYNITKHYLVPKHELLYKNNTDEAKNFKKNKYPLISRLDPVSRFYGFEMGDVIKITRKNNLVTYRIVTK